MSTHLLAFLMQRTDIIWYMRMPVDCTIAGRQPYRTRDYDFNCAKFRQNGVVNHYILVICTMAPVRERYVYQA